MLAKAHITIGLAAAFAITGPDTLPEALPVITGGALGCLICDLDCENKTEKTESSRWRVLMMTVAAAAITADHLLGTGMWRASGSGGPYLWFAGLAGFVLTCAFASVSSHRGFSHSFLALALETASLWLIFPAAAAPFAVAFASHLLLDLTNRKPVRLLYPAKTGICLDWFYADRLANKVFASLGSIWLIIELVICLKAAAV